MKRLKVELFRVDLGYIAMHNSVTCYNRFRHSVSDNENAYIYFTFIIMDVFILQLFEF